MKPVLDVSSSGRRVQEMIQIGRGILHTYVCITRKHLAMLLMKVFHLDSKVTFF